MIIMNYWTEYSLTLILYLIPCYDLITNQNKLSASIKNITLFLGLISHLLLSNQIIIVSGINLNFLNALLIISFITVFIFWILNFKNKNKGLELITLVPAIIIIAINPIFQNDHYITHYFSIGSLTHILLAILGYSVLAFGAIFSLFLFFIEKDLHEKNNNVIFSSANSILDLEKQLFSIYWVGFILLTITLITGMSFSDELFGATFKFNHKFVFSILAWLVYGALLFRRALFGLRGRQAIHLSLVGFVFLLLAYIGTKFVFEILLS